MSATFKLAAKKKYTQNDLRRLMSEQKAKTAKEAAPSTKIDSPLAKYDELGQLTCILCKSVVRSEAVWKVHVNAKQHKQNVEVAKQLKERTHNFTKPAPVKRSAEPIASAVPAKVPKGILKNSSLSATTSAATITSEPVLSSSKTNGNDVDGLPSNFFDNDNDTSNYFARTLKKTSIKADLVNIKRGNDTENAEEEMDVEQQKDETLPEGFFDDPVKDAKARNLDYKDPNELEWERFQHEIKEASDIANALIAEEQVEATTERQIDEIHEQMRNWSRVLELEKKKESTHLGSRKRIQPDATSKMEESESDDDAEDGNDIDEYLDWRAKKAHK